MATEEGSHTSFTRRPSTTELIRFANESKLINVDVPVSDVLRDIEKNFDPVVLGWGCLFGSGYILVYSDD